MAWAKPAGAWAQAVEEEEAEQGPILVPVVAKEKEFPSLGDAPDRAGFPSLGAAAAVKDSKKERRKKQTMSLADFVSTVDAPKPGTFVPSARVGGSALRRPLNDDDILRNLPTTSRGKVEGDEKPGDRLGGSFRDYGGDRAGGRYGDDDRRRGDGDDMGGSRADAADSWGMERKFVPGGASSDRGRGFGSGSGGGFGDRRDRSPRSERDESGPSRADTVDDWGAARQFVPSSGGGRPGSGSGDRFGERREYEEVRGPSRADTEPRWERSGLAPPPPTAFDERPPPREGDDRRGGFGGSWSGGARREGFRGGSPLRSGSSERADNWRRAEGAASPSAEGAPPPRVRLSLAVPEAASRGASRASVFGAARPREEVLAQVPRGPDAEARLAELAEKVAALQRRVEAGEGEEVLVDEASAAAKPADAGEEGAGAAGEGDSQASGADGGGAADAAKSGEAVVDGEASKEKDAIADAAAPAKGTTVAEALRAASAELQALRLRARAADPRSRSGSRAASARSGDASPLRAPEAARGGSADAKATWRHGEEASASGAARGRTQGRDGEAVWTGGHFRDRQRRAGEEDPAPRDGPPPPARGGGSWSSARASAGAQEHAPRAAGGW
ncbi:hypothetical protein ACKKBG_A38820 [Auxenochlorella protothecoides x Auxenochlorella symbiontica]